MVFSAVSSYWEAEGPCLFQRLLLPSYPCRKLTSGKVKGMDLGLHPPDQRTDPLTHSLTCLMQIRKDIPLPRVNDAF